MPDNPRQVIGESLAWKALLAQLSLVARTDASVLIQGETGAGKDVIARTLHEMSGRSGKSFIKLNCASIPTGLLESELFGHEKGAFTGAVSQKVGRMEQADGGTLFLDEIGEIPLEVQPKLLRALQDREFERLGGTETLRVDVRLISATNRQLVECVANRLFRADLYYRINVFPIRVPPLRDRGGDISLLAQHFVERAAREAGRQPPQIPTEVLSALNAWYWPGNVRELENFMERSVLLSSGKTLRAPLEELKASLPQLSALPKSLKDGSLRAMQREKILRTLRETGGVVGGSSGAAARLGMKRTTLQSRMQKLGITRDDYLG
jgi:formate hydrogenlyase transcriptional activator